MYTVIQIRNLQESNAELKQEQNDKTTEFSF